MIELTLVLVIMSLAAMLVIGQIRLSLDRIATRDAVRGAADTMTRAREEAMSLRTPVSVRIDTVLGTLELIARGAAFARSALGETHRVTIRATRDSITFDVRGLGYGAANLTLVAARGGARDTLVLSRLGRVRQ